MNRVGRTVAVAGIAGLGWGAHAAQDLGLWEAVAAIGPGAYAVERADEMATVAQQLARGFVMDDVSSALVKALYRDLLSLHLDLDLDPRARTVSGTAAYKARRFSEGTLCRRAPKSALGWNHGSH